MNNLKGYAVANDGAMKRIAVTYDRIDDNGKVIVSNVRINRIINQERVLEALQIVEEFAQKITEEDKS